MRVCETPKYRCNCSPVCRLRTWTRSTIRYHRVSPIRCKALHSCGNALCAVYTIRVKKGRMIMYSGNSKTAERKNCTWTTPLRWRYNSLASVQVARHWSTNFANLLLDPQYSGNATMMRAQSPCRTRVPLIVNNVSETNGSSARGSSTPKSLVALNVSTSSTDFFFDGTCRVIMRSPLTLEPCCVYVAIHGTI